MGAVSDILSGQQGPYRWGARDCLTTARALVDGLLGRDSGLDYSEWHALPEARAMAAATRRFGSLGEGHATVFGALDGVDVLDGETPSMPGDIVWLEGTVSVNRESWDTAARGSLIGFVGDSRQIFHWTPVGLLPAGGDYRIERVFRCRR